MKINLLVIAALFFGTFSFVNAQSIVTEKSMVNFEIGNMKFKTVEGTFSGMKGEVNFNSADISGSNFEVCIDAASVNTGNKKRDDHLRNEDFFHVDKYPTICFESTSITKNGTGFVAKGNLSMHGVTKQVEIPFTYNNNTFTGTLELKRLDYKVGESTGTFMVSNPVEMTITCVVR